MTEYAGQAQYSLHVLLATLAARVAVE